MRDDITDALDRERAAAELASWRRDAVSPLTALHAAAAGPGEDRAAQLAQRQKAWQAGMDAAVQDAVDTTARKGLGQRERRRAATRAAVAYQRKHPRP